MFSGQRLRRALMRVTRTDERTSFLMHDAHNTTEAYKLKIFGDVSQALPQLSYRKPIVTCYNQCACEVPFSPVFSYKVILLKIFF